MVYCRNCGQQIDDSAQVCPYCNAAQFVPTPQPETPAQPATPAPVAPQPQVAAQPQPQPAPAQPVVPAPVAYEAQPQPAAPQPQVAAQPQPAPAQPVNPAPGQYVPQPQVPQPGYAPQAQMPVQNVNDSGSFGWALLGFFIPIVGLVLFLVWKDSKPRCAKAAGKGALVSVIVWFVLTVLSSCMTMSLYY